MPEPVVHVLKTAATVWDAVASGEKRFDVRLNDRFFQRGDVVRLRKLDETGRNYATEPGKRWSTYDLDFRIGWILQGGQFGLDPRYIAFQLEEVK